MAVKSITVFTGYYGFYPCYHTLYYEVPDKIHPKHSKRIPKQNIMTKNSKKFTKVHKNNKRSTNYEGYGKNFID